jgi:uncharacterized protein YjbI with pentapeptide repeats
VTEKTGGETARRSPRPPVRFRFALLFVFALTLVGSAVLLLLAWWAINRPAFPLVRSTDVQVSIDALRMVLSVVAGTGGVVALLVLYRRQRYGEIAEHREATKLRHERFTKAVELLGHDSPAVRLGGVHALATIADDGGTSREDRQMCIDVLCSYLRTPHKPEPSPEENLDDNIAWHANREVRHTVLRIIAAHLRRDGSSTVWQGHDFDLRGVTIELDLDLRGASLSRHGSLNLSDVTFRSGTVDFGGATFSGGTVSLVGPQFRGGGIRLDGATFSGGTVDFGGAEFSGGWVGFDGATFSGGTLNFDGARISGGTVDFGGADFSDNWVGFESATFSGGTLNFGGAKFRGSMVGFVVAEFRGTRVSFGLAAFSGGLVGFDGAEFSGGTVSFRHAEISGGTVGFDSATFSNGTVDFDGAEFSGGRVTFEDAVFEAGFEFGGDPSGSTEVVYGLPHDRLMRLLGEQKVMKLHSAVLGSSFSANCSNRARKPATSLTTSASPAFFVFIHLCATRSTQRRRAGAGPASSPCQRRSTRAHRYRSTTPAARQPPRESVTTP